MIVVAVHQKIMIYPLYKVTVYIGHFKIEQGTGASCKFDPIEGLDAKPPYVEF